MKKTLLIGRSGAGKTSLVQRVQDSVLSYKKTQAVDYSGDFIDTPGEYLEQRGFYRAIITLSCEADIIAIVQDSTDEQNLFPSGIARTFEKTVVGIATKCDSTNANIARTCDILKEAGASIIVATSAFTGAGIEELLDILNSDKH